ncbi:MAG: peptide chain release factor 1 [Acidobacteria bacterium]|nr:peptide chain release factor 1 [Acidobacteriota bacterium]
MQQQVLTRLEELETKFEALNQEIVRPEVIQDTNLYTTLIKQHAELNNIVSAYRRLLEVETGIADSKGMLESEDDPEMRELASEEVASLEGELETLESDLLRMLLPKDPNDAKNVVVEVRAGTGGEEAALFAAEIFRMYQRYAERHRWTVEIMTESGTGTGGLKEVIAVIEGKGAYSRLKHESGVHRVQRVPETESSGRIHTSAITVAVMPEAEEVEIDIDMNEVRIDRFCSSGPGGQSVNTTQSAIRLTHEPTGLVVSCQDEKSQHKNLAKALRVLRSRLYDLKQQEMASERAAERKGMVGGGDRSEKIRTYNFPQNRVTDHRIHLTVHKLPEVLAGDLDELLDQTVAAFEAQRLEEEFKTAQAS